MSVQSEIDRIKGNVADVYAAVEEKGGGLPEEQTSNNLAEAVRGIPSGGSGDPSAGEIYSTEETRIGTWIDGKPLYRKVAQFNAPTGESEMACFMFSKNIHPVSMTGILDQGGTLITIPFLYAFDNMISVFYRSSQIFMKLSGYGYYGKPVTLIVEYTD